MYQIALLLLSLGAGTTALSGDLTLTLGSSGVSPSPHFQVRDPNGSNRKVLLAALPGTQGNSTGMWYVIRNAGTANTLIVKDSADAITYATLNPGDWVYMIASGATTATWFVAAGSTSATTITLTGALNAASAVISGALSAAATTITGRMTTTDGVASGTARVVGGNENTKITGTTLTNSAAETVLASHVLPANTIKASTSVRVSGAVRVTGNAAADTLVLKVKIGGSTVIQTTTLTMIANDIAYFDAVIVGRAAASAASSCAFAGMMGYTVAGTGSILPAVNAPANLATNGALTVALSGQWSAASALDIVICEAFIVDTVG